MEWLRIIVIGIKLLYLFEAQRLSCQLAWRSVGLKGSVDGLRLSTPTNPQGAPPVGWRHDGVVCVGLGIPKWQCHFGSSPRHLLGQIQRELPAYRT